MKLRAKGLAEALSVSTRTIREWDLKRLIPKIKVGRVVLYDLEKVEQALAKFERKAQ